MSFLAWGGVDHALSDSDGLLTTLKAYLNLVDVDPGGEGDLLGTLMRQVRMPSSESFLNTHRWLSRYGFAQETKLGVRQDGRVGCTVYYELPEWDEAAIAGGLELSRIDCDETWLYPSIPRILSPNLAEKRLLGIALSVNPADGEVESLSTVAQFPSPLVSASETRCRVLDWLRRKAVDPTEYDRISSILASEWDAHERTGWMHALFAQTCSTQDKRVTLYLRPYLHS